MRVPPLSPAGALSLAWLLLVISLPLDSSAEGLLGIPASVQVEVSASPTSGPAPSETPVPEPSASASQSPGPSSPTPGTATSTLTPAGIPSLSPTAPSPSPSPDTPGLSPTLGPSPGTPNPSPSASLTISPSPSATLSPSPELTGSPTHLSSTPTPTPPPLAFPPQSILINELAWAGTVASSSDEWIELHNPGPQAISLTGWKLMDGADIAISLSGSLAPYGFYLLERTDDTTVTDIAADNIYTGSLSDGGEVLQLYGPTGELVDSANSSGGGWPAGSSLPKASMERRGGEDFSGNWGSYTGYNGNGRDASGNSIRGTPRQTNSLFFPTPTPTGIPSRIVINEVLIRPRHDWEGTGGVTTADEFIELYNAGPLPVYLKGWWLDDVAGAGSAAYDLPGVTISPRGFAVFFRTKTKIALNDTGDTVRLLAPDGRLIDQISYLRIRAANLSYGRLSDGSNNMRYGLWPTPRMPNLLFEEPIPPQVSRFYFGLPCTGQSLTLLTRATRHPAQVAWLGEMYFVACEIYG